MLSFANLCLCPCLPFFWSFLPSVAVGAGAATWTLRLFSFEFFRVIDNDLSVCNAGIALGIQGPQGKPNTYSTRICWCSNQNVCQSKTSFLCHHFLGRRKRTAWKARQTGKLNSKISILLHDLFHQMPSNNQLYRGGILCVHRQNSGQLQCQTNISHFRRLYFTFLTSSPFFLNSNFLLDCILTSYFFVWPPLHPSEHFCISSYASSAHVLLSAFISCCFLYFAHCFISIFIHCYQHKFHFPFFFALFR